MKKAIIIGAGPAGLTAAYQFLKETDIVPVILEESGFTGGISPRSVLPAAVLFPPAPSTPWRRWKSTARPRADGLL